MSEFDQRTDRFLHWFTALPGASFSDKIQLVDRRGQNAGRGIIAAQDIPAETTLFTIPRGAIINTDTSDLTRQAPGIFETPESNGWDGNPDESAAFSFDAWSSLILVLLYEFLKGARGESSWQPYLEVLPSSFETPMFWTAPQLLQLQASPSRSRIGREEAEDLFRTHLVPLVRRHAVHFRNSEGMSDEDLVGLMHRMGSTIMAYAFDLEAEDDDDDDGKEPEDGEDGWVEDDEKQQVHRGKMGMVPMADMLNADAEFNAHIHHGEDVLTATSLRAIPAGEEVLNYYGPLPNSELLRRYGYVTPRHARYDVVEIPWALVREAVFEEAGVDGQTRMELLREDEDEEGEVFVIERDADNEGPTSEGIFEEGLTPRIARMPEDWEDRLKEYLKNPKLADLLTPGESAGMDEDRKNKKRKRKMLEARIMVTSLRRLEGSYGSSLEEDEGLLRTLGAGEVRGAEGAAEDRRRGLMALEVRIGEKRLLREAIALMQGKVAEVEGVGDGHKRRRIG